MARILKMQSRHPNHDSAGPDRDPAQASGAEHEQLEATITQALYMVRLYTEILAMDEKIINRIRQLVATRSKHGDYEGSLDNMRLILAQLEKIGRRIAYWNSRLRTLLQQQVPMTVPRAGPGSGAVRDRA